MVKVPAPVQPVPPVSVHVPVIEFHVVFPDESVVPLAVPVKVKVLPADCTVNCTLADAVVPVAIPLNDPLVVLPVRGKHGPVVRKLRYVTFNEPSPLTVNEVVKLNTPTPAPLPISADSHNPLPACVVDFVLLLPHPMIMSCRARKQRMARFRSEFFREELV